MFKMKKTNVVVQVEPRIKSKPFWNIDIKLNSDMEIYSLILNIRSFILYCFLFLDLLFVCFVYTHPMNQQLIGHNNLDIFFLFDWTNHNVNKFSLNSSFKF